MAQAFAANHAEVIRSTYSAIDENMEMRPRPVSAMPFRGLGIFDHSQK